MTTPICLTIAGSDPSGGAGIQADLKTFSALGCYGASVIAALTAQNTMGVQGVLPIPPEFIVLQLRSVLSDLNVAAIKIGMLATADVVQAVAAVLADYQTIPIVLDPVMISQSGHKLLEDDAIAAIKTHLFPLAALITPNMPEASALLGVEEAHNEGEMASQANALVQLGAQAVLIKGGHGVGDESIDVLVVHDMQFQFSAPRIDTQNTHGTGCTLSAAITANLARGMSLNAAVQTAKTYLSGALEAGKTMHIGAGAGPVHHFYALWQEPQ